MSTNWNYETPREQLLSWSYSLEQPIDLLELLSKTEMYQGTRFFWRSADLKESFLGLGTVLSISETDFAKVSAFKKALTEQIQLVDDQSSAPILFGGFPFDVKGSKESFWNSMEAGYFVLPQILFQQLDNQLTVTLTVKKTAEKLLKELANQVEELLSVTNEPAEEDKTSFENTVSYQELQLPQWLSMVETAVAEINSEDSALQKIVAARQLAVTASKEFVPAEIVANLAAEQPNTYLFLLEKGEHFFVGTTPERLLKADATKFYTASIAGTAPRDKNPNTDKQLGQKLLADPKNSHEHGLVVAGIQEQLAELIEGALELGERQILKNRDLQHIYLPLAGQRKASISFLAAVQKLHPTPALGGQPKALALDWLEKNEKPGRGLYGAPIGWQSLATDEGEFAVAIRSGIFTRKQGLLYAGCGIVAKSVAEEERQETWNKFQPMLRGIRGK
ncbi:isochorismate synthase [Enterococcus sp. HY326]|uniref:isochorismate synthase n=1 Tax=Enterococcus sp. HY326 TaxID=2971265 RepID=UPI002240D83D|nr:isochorismate synthase [Enterococcus sp. HY326]